MLPSSDRHPCQVPLEGPLQRLPVLHAAHGEREGPVHEHAHGEEEGPGEELDAVPGLALGWGGGGQFACRRALAFLGSRLGPEGSIRPPEGSSDLRSCEVRCPVVTSPKGARGRARARYADSVPDTRRAARKAALARSKDFGRLPITPSRSDAGGAFGRRVREGRALAVSLSLARYGVGAVQSALLPLVVLTIGKFEAESNGPRGLRPCATQSRFCMAQPGCSFT